MFVQQLELFNRRLLYVTIISAFIGPAFFVIDLGAFHLFAFRLLWFLLILSAGLFFIFNGRIIMARLINTRGYLIFLLLWLSYGFLSLIWAADKLDAIRQLAFMLMGVSIIIFVIIFFNQFKDYLNLQVSWIATLVLILVIGFWNIITGQHLNSSNYAGTIRYIPTSVFYYQNDLATHLAISLPFLTSLFRFGKKIVFKILASMLILFTLGLLLMTGSRINLLAIIVGFIFWFIFLADRRMKAYGIVLVLLAVIIFSSAFFYAPEEFHIMSDRNLSWGIDRALSIFSNIYSLLTEGVLITDASIDSRINFFRNGYRYLIESYGLGVGAGNAEYYMEHRNHYDTYGYYNPHNWWLEIAVNYGIIILLAFLWYYISLIVNLYRLFKTVSNPSEKMLSEALLLSLVIFFFASMSSSSLFGYGSAWILFAFATGFINWFRQYVEHGKLSRNS